MADCKGSLRRLCTSDRAFSKSYLEEIGRIATRVYDPTDDDIVRARLRTIGVQQYRLKFETGLSFHSISHVFVVLTVIFRCIERRY